MWRVFVAMLQVALLVVFTDDVDAADLYIPEGSTVIISTSEVYGKIDVYGTLIIESTGDVTVTGSSGKSGARGCCAEIIINGGILDVNARFDTDGAGPSGGAAITLNGGIFEVDDFKLPDNCCGPVMVTLNAGVLHALSHQPFLERNFKVVIGNGVYRVNGDVEGGEDTDPRTWLTYDPPALVASEGYSSDDILIEYISGGDYTEIRMLDPNLARTPDPARKFEEACPNLQLSWTSGRYVADVNSHDVYFGTDFSDVNDANTITTFGVYKGREDANRYPESGTLSLELDAEYYWRVDEVNDGNIWKGEVWWFTTNDGTSYDPNPEDDSGSIMPNPVLNWKPGCMAVSHRIYIGTDFNNVNDANQTYHPNLDYNNVDVNNYGPVGALKYDTTYYWRIDDVGEGNTWKGEVWSFTTNCEWTYDGGIMLGAYYYPWHGPGAGGHDFQTTLRDRLVPQQAPALGHYNNMDPNVVTSHIKQSVRGNIHFWAVSWWGPGEFTDRAFSNVILTNKQAGKLKYAIMYESTNRLKDDYSRLLSDFQYFAQNYFDDLNYLKVNGKPVVFIYLTRVYFRDTAGYQALADLRAAFPNIFIVADDIFGPGYSSGYASYWDALTAYDVYGQTLQFYGSTMAALNELENVLSDANTAAHSVNVGLVPFAAPGFNDKAVREGHDAAPRYFEDDPQSEEGDLFRTMLEEVVVSYVDPLAANMLMITSFNEWHEDTQIEPTMGTAGTTNQDDSVSGTDYTQGHYYTDYGDLYLDILQQATCFQEGDSSQDCQVDLKDFAMIAAYWLEVGCGDCGGADLNGDHDVNFEDMGLVVDNWLAGTEM